MNYLTITAPDINNGNGLRATIWVAGCRHHCLECQNKHTWDYNQGHNLDESWDEIVSWVSRDYISGITVSGGDPFSQSDEDINHLHEYLLYFKANYPDKNIWIYTGETFEEAITNEYKKRILELADVLVDGPFKCAIKDTTLAFRGSKNQRVIDLNKTFETGEIVQIKYDEENALY